MPEMTLTRPKTLDVEALELSLQALGVEGGMILFIRPPMPAPAAYMEHLLAVVRHYLEARGLTDVLTVVSPVETRIAALDEEQMRRGGWVRLEKVEGLERAASTLRERYRQFQAAVQAGGHVDHVGILRAIEQLSTRVEALLPDEPIGRLETEEAQA